ncbi:MAG TPA: hypothetical protein VNO52_07530 [Methylomirabilota bacterium]|nr:hypothetical protein [Methylomirabilota bacterium]
MTPEPFIPFVPTRAPSVRSAEGSASLKVMPEARSSPDFKSFDQAGLPSERPAGGAPQPKVMLQRTGDQVTGIRIECLCGQVIELACS